MQTCYITIGSISQLYLDEATYTKEEKQKYKAEIEA